MGSKGKRFVIHPDIVFREEEEGGFLFDPKTDTLNCVNGVGASVCRLCDGRRDLEDICQCLLLEYEVSAGPERLRQDVLDFIHRLCDLNIIREAE